MIGKLLRSLADRAKHRLRYDRADLFPAGGRFVRFVARRIGVSRANKKAAERGDFIEHFGVHMPRNNAGDTVLFDVVERLFDKQIGPFDWRLSPLRKRVSREDVNFLNARAKAILVGGGGLFISDSNPDAVSGWQWNLAKEDVEAIEVPLILFAVGYNQFRNGEPFNEHFDAHAAATIEKAGFVGMRNSGSIRGLSQHLPEHLAAKLEFQPCMTTVLRRYHNDAKPCTDKTSNKVMFNLAFDRRKERFGDREKDIFDSVAQAMHRLTEQGKHIVLAVHAWDDDPSVEFVRAHKIKAEIRRLNLDAPADVVKFYSDAPLTIGMRGHSQMIPFGCGNAIFSIVSHPKMGFFLEDIRQPDWGADVYDPDLSEKIVAFVDRFDREQDQIRATIAERQEELWSVTEKNFRKIGGLLAP